MQRNPIELELWGFFFPLALNEHTKGFKSFTEGLRKEEAEVKKNSLFFTQRSTGMASLLAVSKLAKYKLQSCRVFALFACLC